MADFVFYDELKPAGFEGRLEERQDLDFDPQLDVLSCVKKSSCRFGCHFQADGDCRFWSKNSAKLQRAIYELFRVISGWTCKNE